MTTSTDVVLDRKIKSKVEKPKLWKVIMLNDDVTPMDFVVHLLTHIFKKSEEEATDIMLEIHNSGSGIAGIYPFEIAEAKSIESTSSSKANNYPLQIRLEEE